MLCLLPGAISLEIPGVPARSVLSCLFFRVPDLSAHSESGAVAEFASYPQQLSSGTATAVTYRQLPGYYAVNFDASSDRSRAVQSAGALLVLRHEAGAIALFEGLPSRRRGGARELSGQTVIPVYGADGVMAVPTGQVFVRFGAGTDARDRASDLAAVGYDISRVLDFAPQGAWVMAQSGHISDSLQALDQLAGLAGVETVEPQMLIERRDR